MTSEKKQEYTLKITQANKTQLIVILYEMTLTYLGDAIKAHGADDKTAFRLAISRARGCLNELMASLHFEYALAIRLLELYIFINKEMARAYVRTEPRHLKNAAKIITELLTAYGKLSRNDNSAPVMENAQIVYSGLTYDRKNALDSLSNHLDRGYRV